MCAAVLRKHWACGSHFPQGYLWGHWLGNGVDWALKGKFHSWVGLPVESCSGLRIGSHFNCWCVSLLLLLCCCEVCCFAKRGSQDSSPIQSHGFQTFCATCGQEVRILLWHGAIPIPSRMALALNTSGNTLTNWKFLYKVSRSWEAAPSLLVVKYFRSFEDIFQSIFSVLPC